MSRAELGNLTPTAAVTATTQTGTVNNPLLDPIRAKTADLALEWYFSEGSLLSVAYFYKDIETLHPAHHRRRCRTASSACRTRCWRHRPPRPTDIFNVSRWQNTRGWSAEGLRAQRAGAVQLPAGLLEQLRRAGQLHESRVGDPVHPDERRRRADVDRRPRDLVDLSPNTASGTLFYDDGTFSIRTTGSYRDKYIRGIPASPGSDVRATRRTCSSMRRRPGT